MPGYLTLAEFKDLSLMPGSDVDAIEASYAGWIARQLDYWSRNIDSRLRKRYGVPFATPYPITVLEWLSRIVTVRCYLKRGVDPNDLQFAEIKEDAEDAWKEITEAANSETGLFDLPLSADGASGISRGSPHAYTEASPYVAFDRQRVTGREEDCNGEGSDV